MNPISIIEKYYNPAEKLYEILVTHSRSVAEKALFLAEKNHLKIDVDFVYEAAMLHDIGIFLTDAPRIECFGTYPYICHGYLGADLLREEGFPRHALVCERHTGTGISLKQIQEENLPLPQRNMQPQTMEEQLICFADKFFSKRHLQEEETVEETRRELQKYGQAGVEKFDAWCRLFLS